MHAHDGAQPNVSTCSLQMLSGLSHVFGAIACTAGLCGMDRQAAEKQEADCSIKERQVFIAHDLPGSVYCFVGLQASKYILRAESCYDKLIGSAAAAYRRKYSPTDSTICVGIARVTASLRHGMRSSDHARNTG